MSPRTYRLGRRQAGADRTRARILEAARLTLADADGPTTFSIDSVGRRAGVARMTVYYQFGSRRGLLEALFDDLAERGHMDRLPQAFGQADPADALRDFVAAFGRFWATDRLTLRRLRSLAALDPELAGALRARDERRRHGLRVIVHRLAEARGGPAQPDQEDVVSLLFALTGFEYFDALAGPDRSPEEVAPLVVRAALALL